MKFVKKFFRKRLHPVCSYCGNPIPQGQLIQHTLLLRDVRLRLFFCCSSHHNQMVEPYDSQTIALEFIGGKG